MTAEVFAAVSAVEENRRHIHRQQGGEDNDHGSEYAPGAVVLHQEERDAARKGDDYG